MDKFIRVDMTKCAKTKPCLHFVEIVDSSGEKVCMFLSAKVIVKKFWSKLSDVEKEHFSVYKD